MTEVTVLSRRRWRALGGLAMERKARVTNDATSKRLAAAVVCGALGSLLVACTRGPGDLGAVPGAVRVIRGDPNQTVWLDLTIQGVGLGSYEGRLIVARVGRADRPPERLGAGQTRIANSTFTLSFPRVHEPSLYKRKLVFIDLDRDGVCTPKADRVYASFSPSSENLILVVVAGTDHSPTRDEYMPPSLSPDRDCQTFGERWPEN